MPQMGEENLPDEDLGPVLRIHDAPDQTTILQVNVRPDRAEGDSLGFDQGAVIGRCGEDRIMAALQKLACHAEIRVYVSLRAEAGDDDALPHAWSHAASIGLEAD
jgi:hypothetical protein